MYLNITMKTLIEHGFDGIPDIQIYEAAIFFENRRPESGIIVCLYRIAQKVFSESNWSSDQTGYAVPYSGRNLLLFG